MIEINKLKINLLYSITSNISLFIISAVSILILPKILSISEYGEYQLYLLYLMYIGFLHFGLSDGLYLKIAGKRINEIDKETISKHISVMVIFYCFLISTTLIIYNLLFDSAPQFILVAILINVIILNLKNILNLILQATNEIKKYSVVNVLDRLLFILFIFIIIFFDSINLKLIISFDLLVKMLTLLISLYFFREYIYFHYRFKKKDFIDFIENITIGFNLMFANITSLLSIGIIRFSIEKFWDIIVFAKVSLVLSLTNFLLIFINAISIVFFPIIKKVKRENISLLYINLRYGSIPIFLVLIIIAIPLSYFIEKWLPNYNTSIEYLYLIYPLIFFECKFSLLTLNFLKALRLEKKIFIANFITLLIVILLLGTALILKSNLNVIILLIFVTSLIKSTLAEIYLSKYFKLNFIKSIIIEILITFTSVIILSHFSYIISFILICLLISFYLITFKTKILSAYKFLLKYRDY